MAYKYLDKTGLAYFWTKIKAYVASLVSSKADDSNVVHKTGAETVSGAKTFTSAINANEGILIDYTGTIDNVSRNHKVGFDVNNTSLNAGVWDYTNSKWSWLVDVNGDSFFYGRASTAVKLHTARSLATKLDSTAAVVFDGSANQNAIPVTGILPVANGGTGLSSLDSFVRISGSQTVTGLKTFSNHLDLSYEGINALRFRDTRKSAGVPLQSTIYQGMYWYDNDGKAATAIYKRYNADTDSYSLCFNAYAPDNGDGDDRNTQLALSYPSASNLSTPSFYIGPEVKLNNVKVRRTADNSRMLFCGGSDSDFGATLALYGKDHSSYPGWASIHAKDGTNDRRLVCKSSGYLVWTGYQYQLLCEHIEKNVTPQTTQYSGYTIRDRNDDVVGAFQFAYRTDGSSDVKIGVFPTDDPSTDFGAIYVGSDANGNYYGKAPSTSTLRDAGTDIVTRNWIPKDTRIVHTTGAETISGVKTFNSRIEINTGALDTIHFNYSNALLIPSTFPADTAYRGYSVRDGAGRILVECYHRVNSTAHAKVWQMHNLSATDATAQFAFIYNNSTNKFYLAGPAQFDADDDSTKIPNTAWVRDATGNFACNAATATKLKTARTINGVSFDGSANITVADSTKLPLSGGFMTGNINWSETATISGASKTHSAQLTMNDSSLNFGAYDNTNSKWIFVASHDGTNTFNGNSKTADKLSTARTIRTNLASADAVSFDGSANVAPGVTGTLPVANGGTGLTSLDTFVRTTGNQTIGGNKTFIALPIIDRTSSTLAAGALSHVLSCKYKNSANNVDFTTYPISVIGNDNTNATNIGVRLGSVNGTTVVSAGECGATFCSARSKYNDENLYLIADNEIHIYPKCSNDSTSFAGPVVISGTAASDGTNSTTSITATSFIGNASTATKLATARAINGVNFDGSADITVADSTKLPLSGGTMTGNLLLKSATPTAGFLDNDLTKGTNPTSTNWSGIYFCDKTGNTNTGNRSGALEIGVNNSGTVSFYMRSYKWAASNTSNVAIAVHYPASGSGYTEAPTPDTNDNSTKIATTAFVKAQGYITSSGTATNVSGIVAIANGGTGATTLDGAGIVTKTGDQTIGGVKTFSSSPYITRINPYLFFVETDWAKGDTTGNTSYQGIYFKDKNSETSASVLYHYYPSSQASVLEFTAYDMTSPSATASSKVVFSYRSSDVSFIPDVSNTVLLGRSDKKWQEVWCNQSSINSSSDERMKRSVASMPDEVLDAWGDVGWVQYRWADSVAEKGDGARLHSGLIAQDIDRRFRARGLDVSRYGLFLHDEWDAKPEERDPEGNLVAPAREAGDAYGLRYVEALCMEAAYMRRENARLKKRVADLEERLAALELKIS